MLVFCMKSIGEDSWFIEKMKDPNIAPQPFGSFLLKTSLKIQFLVIKTLDPDPDPDSLEMLDPGGSVSGSRFHKSGSTTQLGSQRYFHKWHCGFTKSIVTFRFMTSRIRLSRLNSSVSESLSPPFFFLSGLGVREGVPCLLFVAS